MHRTKTIVLVFALCILGVIIALRGGRTVQQSGPSAPPERKEASHPAPTPEVTTSPTAESTPVPISTPTLEQTLPLSPVPVPVQTPGSAVIITKNPTSETLSIGGNTWFIAHAENAVSLTWELVDPDGNVHSVSDAMTINPGLSLEILEGDTIAVSNVPISVNGWSVRARFDGQGNSATSSPAYIYVLDYLSAYMPVLQNYLDFFSSNMQDGGLSADYLTNGDASYYIIKYGTYDVSFLVRYSTKIGYYLKDLNKDGIPEMLIGSMPTESNYPPASFIVDMFTLENGTPKRVVASSERVRYGLRSDDLIYLDGSGGAAYNTRDLYRFNGISLERITSARMEDRNFYLDDAPTSEEEFWQKANEFESQVIDFQRTALN